MLGNEVSDYKQLKAIRQHLDTDFVNKRFYLKNLIRCGAKVLIADSPAAGVAVIANKTAARFYGVATCKSPWCCPVCTAKQMAKYATDISCAIDALKEQDQVAVMITLTVPHTSGFTCEQTTEILYNTWKMFTVHGNKVLATAKNDVFSNFMAAFNSKHRIRVCEYTWGKSGWHPHFHCLFWFPKENVDKILEWEERLNQRWLELAKRYTIRQLLLNYPVTERKTVKAQVATRVNIMYSKLNSGSSGVYISKKDNKVIRCESSQYICGWGYDKEITGNSSLKATSENHYTWQQILENAMASDLKPAEGSRKNEDAADAEQVNWWELYFEYAIATKKYRHARINFSVHSGIKKIIADWKKTQQFEEVQKKSIIEAENKNGKWKTVCWFTPEQWSSICNYNLECDILRVAILDNAFEEIEKLLEMHQLPPPIKPEAAGRKIDWIEKQAA